MTDRLRRVGIIAAAFVAGIIGMARADAAGVVTTSLLLPLRGMSLLPPSPCVPTGEQVALSGYVHAVTAVFPPNPVMPQKTVSVFLNTADVTGTGQSTGNLYLGTGAFQQPNIVFPPSPVSPSFQLQGTDGCMSTALPVTVTLVFDASGNLLPASTAKLSTCTQDKCF